MAPSPPFGLSIMQNFVNGHTDSGQSGNRLRPILPNVPDGGNGRRTPSPAPASKRKRTTVAAACQNCRKRKVKCDGIRPICQPCGNSGATCEYSVPAGLSQREGDRRKMGDLRTILRLLRYGPELESAEILRQVRAAKTLDEAVARITEASLLLPAPPDSPRPYSVGSSSSGYRAPSPGMGPTLMGNARMIASPFDKPAHMFERLYEKSFRDGEGSGLDSQNVASYSFTTLYPVSRWTTVISDDRRLTHILTLFWTWDNTFINILDRELFLEDLHDLNPSAPRPPGINTIFCCPFLVNCLLACGCIYSTQTEIYAVAGDHSSRGRQFADEAKRLLDSERARPSLMLLQGVALLWLWEGNFGDGGVAENYFEEVYSLYFSMGLDKLVAPACLPALDSRDSRVLQATSHILWQFFYLNSKIGLNFMSRLRVPRPRLHKTFEHKHLSYIESPSAATYYWFAYPVSFKAHPAHFRELLIAQCTFAELVEEIMIIVGLDSDGNVPVMDTATLTNYETMYKALMTWKAKLPEYLQPNNTQLPSVLSLHATFDMAVLKLLTPVAAKLSDQRIDGCSPIQLKLAASYSLIANIWNFRALYTLKHEYWLMQACFTAAQAVLFDLNSGTIDVFVRACQGLHEMGEYLKLANKYLKVIQDLVVKYRVQIPDLGRQVQGKYFFALETRDTTTRYMDNTHVLMWLPYGDGSRAENLMVSNVIASARRVLEVDVD